MPATQPVPADPRLDLLDLTQAELAARLVAGGFKAAHARPLWRHLYRRLAVDPSTINEGPKALPAWLERETRVLLPDVAERLPSNDGHTVKYLLGLEDGQRIETVQMRFTGRHTACLSTQAGCAQGCVFCATGQGGLARNLKSSEIVAQVLHVVRALREGGEILRNIVLMGMGEPLHNYDAVMKAVDIVCDPEGLGMAPGRITLSTVGLVPGILRLADEGRKLSLAVSLHGTTDEERNSLVPAGRRWPLADLVAACRTYSRQLRRKVFFEWTLIDGVNDGPEHAGRLAALLAGIPSQVNVIPLNPTAGYDGRPCRSPRVRSFQEALLLAGIPCTVRQRRGIDIAAGCGQLRVREPR
ncbi:MAG TPA: 23S rRNA (adenine(2503)-C(2))-methyltransferase RlmN [Planctomycetota bacterium]|nr:23S rRNA (adenine(2503)-C(2))-methyltransferase RlmN [Planctomycetota bacterium]